MIPHPQEMGISGNQGGVPINIGVS